MGILPILAAIFAIFIVILLHELGHFLVARAVGVRVLRFSIGFGKALWKHTAKNGTEYVLALLPLGGYVKLYGEWYEEIPPEDASSAYSRKPVWARMAIVIAGPAVNLILAFFLYWAVWMHGVVQIVPVIGPVVADSIAAKAGLQAGDQIISIDNRVVKNWQNVSTAIIARLGDDGQMVFAVRPKNSTAVNYHSLDLTNWHIDTKKPELLRSLGLQVFRPHIPPIIQKVMPGSVAEKAGLLAGDKVLQIQQQKITDWQTLAEQLHAAANQKIKLLVERNGKPITLAVQLGEGKKSGYLGILSKEVTLPPGMKYTEKYSFLAAIIPALQQTGAIVQYNYAVFKKLLTGKLSLRLLGGPITIFETAGQASKVGLFVYLEFIAFVSGTLGFINLLPIPGLDGGHLFFQVIEVLWGRPLPARAQLILLQFGIFMLILIMVLATSNDLIRILF